jgi:hypothetical protein
MVCLTVVLAKTRTQKTNVTFPFFTAQWSGIASFWDKVESLKYQWIIINNFRVVHSLTTVFWSWFALWIPLWLLWWYPGAAWSFYDVMEDVFRVRILFQIFGHKCAFRNINVYLYFHSGPCPDLDLKSFVPKWSDWILSCPGSPRTRLATPSCPRALVPSRAFTSSKSRIPFILVIRVRGNNNGYKQCLPLGTLSLGTFRITHLKLVRYLRPRHGPRCSTTGVLNLLLTTSYFSIFQPMRIYQPRCGTVYKYKQGDRLIPRCEGIAT